MLLYALWTIFARNGYVAKAEAASAGQLTREGYHQWRIGHFSNARHKFREAFGNRWRQKMPRYRTVSNIASPPHRSLDPVGVHGPIYNGGPVGTQGPIYTQEGVLFKPDYCKKGKARVCVRTATASGYWRTRIPVVSDPALMFSKMNVRFGVATRGPHKGEIMSWSSPSLENPPGGLSMELTDWGAFAAWSKDGTSSGSNNANPGEVRV